MASLDMLPDSMIDQVIKESESKIFKDINGEPTPYTDAEIEMFIEALESTGYYDVVGRGW